tara:strand:+ start:305 stop:640 length:336 start_codon:yes stop_codon:yes gene_type:complete
MRKHPARQTDEEIYQETYGKHADAKAKALADAAERAKHDATRPQARAVNDSTLVGADYIPKPLQPAVDIPANRFVQKFKNFSKNVKNFLSAHADRYKKQRSIPMPQWGEDK